MKKAVVICIIALLAMPLATIITPASADDDTTMVEIETIDFSTGKTIKYTLTRAKAEELERAAAEGNAEQIARVLGISFDIGFTNLVFSYGKGNVYVPIAARDKAFMSPERSFLFKIVLRPIFFNYYAGGFTFVKFGANYFWKGPAFWDFGYLLGDQTGMLLGFIGTHIRIPWLLRPDTHIFMGGCLMTIGYNKFM